MAEVLWLGCVVKLDVLLASIESVVGVNCCWHVLTVQIAFELVARVDLASGLASERRYLEVVVICCSCSSAQASFARCSNSLPSIHTSELLELHR